MANFLLVSPRKIGLEFVTENFTTFFTARKSIGHLELTLGGFSRNVSSEGEKCHKSKYFREILPDLTPGYFIYVRPAGGLENY